MLGIDDWSIGLAYLLCLLSALLCVIYGAVMWNRGDESPPSSEDAEWAREEDRISEEF